MLSFTHPLFLLGLLGLAAPVFLHLMNRALPIRIDFPSIRFIRHARLPRQGRRRLRDLLLLLLRLLLLTAIVLALARPVWTVTEPRVPEDGRPPVDTVVMVDVSASLSGWSGPAGLQRRVREVMADVPPDSVGLVVYANRVLRSLPPGTNRAVLDATVSALTTTYTGADPVPALGQSLLLFRPGRSRRLILVSDLQRSSWSLSRLPGLGRNVAVELIPVNPQRHSNCGIAAGRVTPLGAGRLRVVADVRNYGAAPVARTVSLQTGEHTETESVEIPGLGQRRVAFVLDAPATAQATLHLDPDQYPADDAYRVWVGSVPPVTALAVVSLGQEPAKREELFFLRKALEVEDENSPVRFRIETVDTEFFFALTLDRVRALLLLGAAGYFREPEFEKVREFLGDGGVVVCTPGASAGHQFRGLQQHGLLPAEFVEIRSGREPQTGQFGIGWVNPDAEMAGLFPEPETTDLFLFPVRRYARIRSLADMRVLLRFEDEQGDPALVGHRVGAGRLYASCLGFDGTWSDLPLTGSFLPLVRELLAPAVPENRGVERLECGDPLPLQRTLLGEEADDADMAANSATTTEPCLFLRNGIPHQVNVPQRESILEQVNPYDLHARLTGADTPDRNHADEQAGVGGQEAVRRLQFWPAAALAAAALLLLEMACASYLGRRELAGRRG